MPKTALVPVKDLKLDLKNYRTVPQKSELKAVLAMVAIKPDWFWALTESLLDDGYHPTENIIVLDDGSNHVVKEGNRRIGAMKLIHGLLDLKHFAVPQNIEDRIRNIDAAWKGANLKVPCAIYGNAEADMVNKLVLLTHGRGERAGRNAWNAIAKSRQSRDLGNSEPALDLLEKYLREGKNVTPQQVERWAGEYPLSVLDDAIKKLAPRLGSKSSKELATAYPTKVKHRAGVEDLLRDIGLGICDFKTVRDDSKDWALLTYGIPNPNVGTSGKSSAKGSTSNAGAGSAPSGTSGGGGTSPGASPSSSSSTAGGAQPGGAQPATTASAGRGATVAVPMSDQRAVKRVLKAFKPRGKNREKLATLLEEIRTIGLDKHPHAFCFLLRSMFEISAKAYCKDHASTGGPSTTKASGEDRRLVDVLKDVVNHLTKNSTDKALLRNLHGAIADLAKPEGFLSVTSMNQLVHNPKFFADEAHIATLFGNVFPLLEEMNK